MQVRYGALQCIDVFHQKLGEDFMPLLPEAIPFLAELMEGIIILTSIFFCLKLHNLQLCFNCGLFALDRNGYEKGL